MDFQDIDVQTGAKIKVIGVGGGGGNAVNNMIQSALKGVSFIIANTDAQALGRSPAEYKIQLGATMTRGLGAGGNPEVGRLSAEESVTDIRAVLEGADMVFVTAGMGGGTGTGAAPVVARIAKEMGILTVGVVTKPFFFEGKKRMQAAEAGIAEFRNNVDSLITIANDRLVALAAKKASFIEMLKRADEILYHAVKGISDLITMPGIINLDFADLKSVMTDSGVALMGAGVARGENRAHEAAMRAITSPLLEDVSMDGARGVVWNITAGEDLGIDEVSEVASIIQEATHSDAEIIFGTAIDPCNGDELSVTVIATGIDANAAQGAHNGITGLPTSTATRPQGTEETPAKAHITQFGSLTAAATRVTESSVHTSPVSSRTPEESAPAMPHGLGLFSGGAVHTPVKNTQSTQRMPAGNHAPGEDDFIFDEDEFEIPSFIRKQAQ